MTISWAQLMGSLGGIQYNRYLQIVHGFTVLVQTRQVEDHTFLRGSNYFKMMLPVAYNYQLTRGLEALTRMPVFLSLQ